MGIISYFKILFNYSFYVDKDKKYLYGTTFFAIIAAFFEVSFPAILGVGAAVLFNDASGDTFLNYINYLVKDDTNTVFVFSILLMVFALLRYFFVLLFFDKKYKFAMHYAYLIAEKTEHSLLDLDLLSRRKSLNPDLARIIHSETNTITWKFFVPLVDLFHEFIVIIFSLLALSVLSFNLFLACLPLFILVIFYYYFYDSPLKEAPPDDVNFRERLAIFAEIIQNGALDTVSQAKKSWLKNKISSEFTNITHTQKTNILAALKPRPRVETVILIFLGMLIATLNILGVSFLPVYLVGVLIFLRMLMSLGKFHGSIIALRLGSLNAKNVLNKLRPALSFNENGINIPNFLYKDDDDKLNHFSIQLKNLVVGWSQSHQIPIDDQIINKGEILLITGPSGTGKSTLLRTISTSLEPVAGEIIYSNFNQGMNEKEIFYIRQDPHIIPSSLIENLILDDMDSFISLNNTDKNAFMNKSRMLLNDFGFSRERIDSLFVSNNINQSISGGEAQRIAILRLFFSKNVKLCLFDEPTASLDKKNILLVSDLINELSKDKACIVITHDDYLGKLISNPNTKFLNLKN